MSYTIERKRSDGSALPRGWQREADQVAARKGATAAAANKADVFYYRNARNDVALVPPIRQTASIFKQPVTVYKQQESICKADLKHGQSQERPKQLFWEKRLERMRACDYDGVEFAAVTLPKSLRPVGPSVDDDTVLQSVATALHCTANNGGGGGGSGGALNGASAAGVAGAVVGQTARREQLAANPGVYLNPEQPLMQAVDVSEEDIRRQEDRVGSARKRLQEFLNGK